MGFLSHAFKYLVRGRPPIPTAAYTPLDGDGSYILVDFKFQMGASPLLPASSITGFRVLMNGNPIGINSAVRSAANQVRLNLAIVMLPGVEIFLDYGGGNLTDSSGNSVFSFTTNVVNNAIEL